MFITQAELEDAEELQYVISEILEQYHTEEILTLILQEWPEGSLVVRHGHNIEGFLMGNRLENNTARVFAFGVSDRFRSMGFGTKMLKMFLDRCRMNAIFKVVLEVKVQNIRTQRLYRRFGFMKQGLLEDFYNDGSNAFSYIKFL